MYTWRCVIDSRLEGQVQLGVLYMAVVCQAVALDYFASWYVLGANTGEEPSPVVLTIEEAGEEEDEPRDSPLYK